ncbi:MAG: mechanosensitive ion channel family protein [Alphaproteobacteria bacterium]
MLGKDIGIVNIVESIFKTFANIWNYTIYTTTDKQPITLANMIVGVILFILGLRLARYLSVILRVKILNILKLEPTVKNSLEKLSHYLFIVLITLIVLDISHVPLTVFTLIGGALAISIGLGSQNILNNFISGLIIMVEQPIRVGDLVEINNNIGEIITIGARCVHIRTSSNIDILVPNSLMLQNTVINWTLSDNTIRVNSFILINANIDSVFVQNLMLEAIKTVDHVLKDPLPQVYFIAFDSGALKFELQFWVYLKNSSERKVIASHVNHSIREMLAKNNIQLAGYYIDNIIRS